MAEDIDQEKTDSQQVVLERVVDTSDDNSLENRKPKETYEEMLARIHKSWLKYIEEINDDPKNQFKIADGLTLENYATIDKDKKSIDLRTPEEKCINYSVSEDKDGQIVEKITYSKNANANSPMELDDAVAMVRAATLQGWESFKINDSTEEEKGLLYLAMVKINEEAYLKQGCPENFIPIISVEGYTPDKDSPTAKAAAKFKWYGGTGIDDDEVSSESEETPIEEKAETKTDTAPEFTPEQLIELGKGKNAPDYFLQEIIKDSMKDKSSQSVEEDAVEENAASKFIPDLNDDSDIIYAEYEILDDDNLIPSNREGQKLIDAPVEKPIILNDETSGPVIPLGDGSTPDLTPEQLIELGNKNAPDHFLQDIIKQQNSEESLIEEFNEVAADNKAEEKLEDEVKNDSKPKFLTPRNK